MAAASMQLLGLAVTGPREGAEPVILASASDLSQFSFFQRGAMGQLMQFFFRTFAGRTEPGTRSSVAHEGYMCHVHVRADGLAATCVVNNDYPDRVAFTLLTQILEEFCELHGDKWQGQATDNACPMPTLDATLKKYQVPEEADKLMAIQKDLDQTKAIMHDTIESALERGVKLDELIEKSEDLSASSKMFYTTAKKHNQCCILM